MHRKTMLQKLLFMHGACGKLFVEETATGNPATFTTDLAKPLVSLVAPFSPIQAGSGDPSPTNVRAISGFTGITAYRTGINLCGCEWENGQILSDGTESAANDRKRTIGYFPVKGGNDYYIVSNDDYKRVYWYDKDKTFISSNTGSSATKTAPGNACFARAVIVNSSTTPEQFSFNYPSTDTEYHAYTGNSYPVTFPDGQTIYGGTLDLVSGVLTVNMGCLIESGSLNWGVSLSSGLYRAVLPYGAFTEGKPKPESTSNLYTNYLKSSSYSAVGVAYIGSTSNFLCYVPEGITNRDEWVAYLSEHPLQIVYELETPQTIQLDPVTIQTLIGSNTIWTDTNGTNEITYMKKG